MNRCRPIAQKLEDSFDVPTLIQRSRYRRAASSISLARFGKGDVVDQLRDVLTFDDAQYDAVMPRSLSAFCRRFGAASGIR